MTDGDGKRLTSTSWVALATAGAVEPEAPGICTWYGLNRPVIASTASYTAAWTIALSRKLVAPGWEAWAAIVCMAIAFQSVTASARTTDDIARAIAKPSMSTQNLFSSRISCLLYQRNAGRSGRRTGSTRLDGS